LDKNIGKNVWGRWGPRFQNITKEQAAKLLVKWEGGIETAAGKITVTLNPALLQSEEGLIEAATHELTEIGLAEEEFAGRQGMQMTAAEFHDFVTIESAGNWHDMALAVGRRALDLFRHPR